MRKAGGANPSGTVRRPKSWLRLAGPLGIFSALLVWSLAAKIVGSDLILPSPLKVGAALGDLLADPHFGSALSGTLGRVAAAFILSLALGGLTGSVSAFSPFMERFLAPILTTTRATPVLALILVAMFWFPSNAVPVFCAILMAFPVFHTAMRAGMAAADQGLLQMAELFGVPARVRFARLRIPAAGPHLASGAKNALGLCWKVVVAGEVLSQPAFALGTGMQESRLSLETAHVFAWAVTTVALCGITEFLLGRLVPRRPGYGREETA
ncbi:MAG: ABC transporter permease subunit [Rectinema sp.]